MGTQLFQTADVGEQWRAVVGPWLRRQAAQAWREARPTVVLTPSRAEGFYLRERMVREGLPFLGLHFWTPSDARAFLLADDFPGIEAATQGELRLVARACAEKIMERTDAAEASVASVAREPGPFLRAYDLLLGAGWEPAREGAVYGRQLAGELERALTERGIATQAGIHRALWQRDSRDGPLPVANLLVAGFNATHWPLWDLLRATVARAERTVVALIAPRVFGEEVDQLWIGSWEEAVRSAVEIPDDPAEGGESGLFGAWVKAYEQGAVRDIAASDITFRATADLATQVQAVTLQAIEYLKRDSCERLGIVFSEANALALGVADELRRTGVPIDDGTGYLQPGLFERRAWQAWVQLQEEPSVQRLTEWVRACAAEGVSCGPSAEALPAREIAATLDDALGESLVDDLDFLALHLEENSSRRNARGVAEFMRGRVRLPEKARFSEFFDVARRALESLGWTGHLAQMSNEPPAWLREAAWVLSRRTFLEWLRESTDSRERTRGAEGNHFYGKVHLRIYAQMPGQTWTHLILTGLNEGQWPRLFEAGAFGSRHELRTLNRKARGLNRRGTAQGGQGAGQETVAGGHGHCLLPLERQDLALRDLCAAVEATSGAVCLTAMTNDAGRMLLPSDFFNHAYQCKMGRVLDEAAFRALARSTRDWCARQEGLLRPSQGEGVRVDPTATRTAYAARRDPEQPFGRYEFAYAEPPPKPIELSCKRWETAWNFPASVWLENVVGVKVWPEGRLAWPRAVGTWVHRWLATALRACRETNRPVDFLRILRAAAEREPARVRALAERVGVSQALWWKHVWGQARSVALGLGETLAPELQEREFLSELKLPENLRMTLPGTGSADFDLRGRIDLLLLEAGAAPVDAAAGKFTDATCWVVDFKTGPAKKLAEKKLEKATGLQALLYALAVREMGALSVAVSLHTFDAPLKPQVQVEQVLGATGLFRSLDRFHREGIFGMRPGAENDYGFAPAYPMATRSIPAGILEAKWALVHGARALEEEA
jgi:hypothetical protein